MLSSVLHFSQTFSTETAAAQNTDRTGPDRTGPQNHLQAGEERQKNNKNPDVLTSFIFLLTSINLTFSTGHLLH